MRSSVVILVLPAGRQGFGITQAIEQLCVEKLVTDTTVKALGVAVLPGGSGLDIQRLYARQSKVITNGGGNEFRPVVTAYVAKDTTNQHDLADQGDHIHCFDAPLDLKQQAFTGILIDQAQPLQGPTVLITVMDEVPGPDIILARSHATNTTVVAVTQTTLFTLFLRHFQALTFPEAIDSLAVHTPTVEPEFGPNHPISIAWMLANQGMHGGQQERLIVRHPQRVSLRTAGLTQDPACTTL
jgi:hypothetical protein